MSSARHGAVIATITLDRVMLHNRREIAAWLLPHHRRESWRAVDRDALIVDDVIDAWGRTAIAELACPASWWDHLKLAARERWPRLFGKLRVRWIRALAENGAIVAGLQQIPHASKFVIPYQLPVLWSETLDGGSEGER